MLDVFVFAALGLHCSTQAFSSCSIWVFLVVQHGLKLPHSMWDLSPLLGIEPMSSTREGGFLTTGLPGKSRLVFINHNLYDEQCYRIFE